MIQGIIIIRIIVNKVIISKYHIHILYIISKLNFDY